jgi:hypothetical protein
MKIHAFVAASFLAISGGSFAAEEHHVLFDVYYKVAGDVVEHAVVRLPVGAAAKVVLRAGIDVDVGTSAPGADGKSHLLVNLGGRPRNPSLVAYYEPSKDRGSYIFNLPEKRDVTVFVRTAEYWPSGS